ncbi:MAG: glycosyltransferase [Anaerolineae bacterium]|nr:glycosyltransferase [Anaerolineae bacterium]
MKMALVHDWLNQRGGAEDVLETLMTMYPEHPLYTSIYWREKMPSAWQTWDTHTLWIDHLPKIYEKHQAYLPFYPLAWGGADFSEYDVILSNKSGFCHGLKKSENTLHICYCLAPTRYVWQYESYMDRENVGKATRLALNPLISYLRRWDYQAAQRVNHFIAPSTDIQERIKTHYHRDAVVIYPPVKVAEGFQVAPQTENYFLSLGRLVPYKRMDLIVEACSRLKLPLKVAGSGRDLERLKALAGPTVEFLGYVADQELPNLFARAKAFVFPGLEDFGITPVQAQAAGRPVIAYKGGGTLDTVIEGKTGTLFSEQTMECLMATLQKFNAADYAPEDCRANALRFDEAVFREQISTYVAQAWSDFPSKQG